MPSNKELAQAAKNLGERLGEEVDTNGMNNAALTELVSSLEAKAKGPSEQPGDAAPTETRLAGDKESPNRDGAPPPVDGAATSGEGGPPEKTPAPVVSRFPLHVAPGKGLTNPRSLTPLGPGSEIREADYSPEALQVLIDKGYVVDQRKHAK